MGKKDPRVDAYIAAAAEFARPILSELRAAVHAACPDAVETMKWQFPHFDYKGMFCSMAAFKRHAAFLFWKSKPLAERAGGEPVARLERIESAGDLPSAKALRALLVAAMKMNDEGVALPRKKTAPAKERVLEVPDWFLAAVKRSAKAKRAFEAFSYSHKKEYVQWVAGAKTEATRERRLSQAVAWMADGKSRNWKYQRAGG